MLVPPLQSYQSTLSVGPMVSLCGSEAFSGSLLGSAAGRLGSKPDSAPRQWGNLRLVIHHSILQLLHP